MSIFTSNSNIFSNLGSPSLPSLQSMFSINRSPEPDAKEEDKNAAAEEVRSASSSPSPETYKTPEGIQSPVSSASFSPAPEKLQPVVDESNVQLSQHSYTLTSLGLVFLLTAITFFLLGSLVRSLTLPDDYVVYVHNADINFDQLANVINYKVFKKLVQFRIPFMNSDVIFGLS